MPPTNAPLSRLVRVTRVLGQGALRFKAGMTSVPKSPSITSGEGRRAFAALTPPLHRDDAGKEPRVREEGVGGWGFSLDMKPAKRLDQRCDIRHGLDLPELVSKLATDGGVMLAAQRHQVVELEVHLGVA